MTNKRSRIFLGLTLAAITTFSLAAAAKLSKTGSSSAEFHASGPAGMSIDGKTSDLSVNDDGTNVAVVVNLKGLKTGISLRDEHTQKALETDSFPNAELTIARSALNVPAAGASSSGDVKGSMKLHGQSKDVTVHYDAKRDGDSISVSGKTHINMTDFGIKPPSYLGVGVKPEIDIRVSFEAKDG